jgi:HSP20 family protein
MQFSDSTLGLEEFMKWFDDEIEKEFDRMRLRMEKMLGSPSRPGAARLCSDAGWRPSLDLYETSEELIVLVDLAGIKPKEVEVVVDGDTVRLKGNRCRPIDKNVNRVHHMEIDFGPFSHSFRLPVPIDPEGASSTYRDGFLVINLPKKARISTSVSVQSDE